MSLYRQCASAIVFNRKGLVLLGNRIDTDDDAWQFSQGGIENDESPAQAAQRELFEEMSITSVKLVSVDEKPHRYEFPEDIKQHFAQRGIKTYGQDIYFALFYFEGKESEINVCTSCPEFKNYKWSTLDFAVQNIILFKKEVYLAASTKYRPIIEQYIRQLS